MHVKAGLAALVIGSLAAFGNPAGAAEGSGELSDAQRAQLEQSRGEALARMVVLPEPKPLKDAAFVHAERKAGGAEDDKETLTERRLSDLTGGITVLNLWASWCAPCKKEMPSLDRLASSLQGSDVSVMVVNIEPNAPAKARAFFAEQGIENLEIHSDMRTALPRVIGVVGLPVTLVLDREGREIGRLIGDAPWDAPEAKAWLLQVAEMTSAGG